VYLSPCKGICKPQCRVRFDAVNCKPQEIPASLATQVTRAEVQRHAPVELLYVPGVHAEHVDAPAKRHDTFSNYSLFI
jgi:hypothetical protein